jgi:hypothetical protein
MKQSDSSKDVPYWVQTGPCAVCGEEGKEGIPIEDVVVFHCAEHSGDVRAERRLYYSNSNKFEAFYLHLHERSSTNRTSDQPSVDAETGSQITYVDGRRHVQST